MTIAAPGLEFQTINICLCFDKSYVIPASVLMESILAQQELLHYRFFLAVVDVDASTRSNISQQFDNRAEITFFEVSAQVANLPVTVGGRADYISQAMYGRLFIADMMPVSVERFLYLDSDMLCIGPISPIFEVDMQESTVCAVTDAYTQTVTAAGGIPGANEYVSPDCVDAYFNSGLLWVDRRRWLEEDIGTRCIQYLADQLEFRFPDQDALNLVLRGRWAAMPVGWNHMKAWRLEPAARDSNGLESARDSRLRGAVFLHCAGRLKYWHLNFPPGERSRLFWSFRQLLAY